MILVFASWYLFGFHPADITVVTKSSSISSISSISISSSSSKETQDICRKAQRDFKEASQLFAIVTGFPYSGTVPLSALIMSAPKVYGGLQCGILDQDKPADFINAKPYYDWVLGDPKLRLWGLDEESRKLLVSARCDAEMYARLRKHSPLFLTEPNQDSLLLDRTPGYFWRLKEVMDRTPGVPVVVARKTNEDTFRALKKRNFTDEYIEQSLSIFDESMKKAKEKYGHRLYIANTTLWYDEPDKVMNEVYGFLGLQWKSEYLTMEAYNSKGVPGSVKATPFKKELKNSNGVHDLLTSHSDGPAITEVKAAKSQSRRDVLPSEESMTEYSNEPIFEQRKTEDICTIAARDFRKASNLFAIVTGFQHSGTTILSELIMSAPGVFGGFECGILDKEKPSDFINAEPFYDWMMGDPKRLLWGLNEETRDLLVNASCDAEMYSRLRQFSPLFLRQPNQHSLLLDKTPGYFWRLTKVMDRTPGIPVVVTRKTDEAMVRSLKKRNFTDAWIERSIFEFDRSIKQAAAKYPDRLYIANTTLWYDEPDKVMKGVYDFLGLEWKSEYLTMEAFNSKTVPGSVQAVPFQKRLQNSTEAHGLFVAGS